MMLLNTSNTLALSLSVACFGLLPQISSAVEKPNVIIFYVDDLGWQDIELNDIDEPCAYDTPHIKKLAAAGMNITQGYSPAPTCAPSRAAIISGQHPAQTGMTNVGLGTAKKGRASERLADPYLEGHYDTKILTIADALSANGYRTGHSGKWHIGLSAASYGFDVVNQERGVHRSVPDRTTDFATANDEKYPLSKKKYFPQTKKSPEGISYPYDEVTESAIDFIEKNKEEPFFLNLCHWMVHWPMLTRNGELLEYYCDKFDQPFPPKKGDMTEPGQRNPYFAAMVTTVDWSLGRMVDYLESTDDPRNPGKKLSETTYIFFTSDNGGAESRGPEILSDNAPLKYGKKYSEEGGIRVPMVITGPSIKPETKYDGLVNQLDYFPTILNLTQSTIKPNHFEKLSGLDITPVLESKSQDIIDAEGKPRQHLFWHFPHHGDVNMKSAIRSGDFKLYKRHGFDDYELYRLYKDGQRADLEEKKNLAENPEFNAEVVRLGAILDQDLAAVNTQPIYLNPEYKEKTAPAINMKNTTVKVTKNQAVVTIAKTGPALKQAFAICQPHPTSEQKGKRHKGTASALDELMGMKHPAQIAADGYSASATLPKGVKAAIYMLVDEHNYIYYTKLAAAPAAK